jgi:hypothetical protein
MDHTDLSMTHTDTAIYGREVSIVSLFNHKNYCVHGGVLPPSHGDGHNILLQSIQREIERLDSLVFGTWVLRK